MQTNYNTLSKYYYYDKATAKVKSKLKDRTLLPDEYGSAVVYDNTTKTKAKIKYSKLCWILGNQKDFPEGMKLYHVNMQDDDFRLRNLKLIDPQDFKLLQEAKRNLEGSLRILAHPEDAYSMQIKYVQNGKHITETIRDVIPAKRRFSALQLRFAKVLSKFCRSDV